MSAQLTLVGTTNWFWQFVWFFSYCNIIMMKMERWTFILLLWVDFKPAEAVVGQESTALPNGYSFPGQINRVGALRGNVEVLRLCEWNWKKWNHFKKEWTEGGAFSFLSLCVLWWVVYASLYLLFVFISLFCFRKVLHIYIKQWVNQEDTYLPLCGKKHTFYLSEVSH